MNSLCVCLVFFGCLCTGSALRCFSCSDYTKDCVQECTYEDACLSLVQKGGTTVRRCIRYTECNHIRLGQMFPASSGLTYRCCSSNLCNHGPASATATRLLCLLASLLVYWWCGF